jgi:hypothetical protein
MVALALPFLRAFGFLLFLGISFLNSSTEYPSPTTVVLPFSSVSLTNIFRPALFFNQTPTRPINAGTAASSTVLPISMSGPSS